MTLRRPQSQQLQKESILAVESVVNQMNCEFRRHEPDNAGIDGEIDLVKALAFEGKLIKTQIKAGLSYVSSENADYVRVKVERKYVELWARMNVPVVLLFYHPQTKTTYWKSLQDYLRTDSKILKQQTRNVIVPFDKARDAFSPDVLHQLRLVAGGQFGYEKIIYTEDDKEEVLSNWFQVESLPTKVYATWSHYKQINSITNKLEGYYAFILKDGKLYTFSDLNNPDSELARFCDCSQPIEPQAPQAIEANWYMELLNRMILIFMYKRGLYAMSDRFYFPSKVLKDPAQARFPIKPLRREKETSRQKIYISKIGDIVEYKHMAVTLSFVRLATSWLLQIQPEWHFSYPLGPKKSKRELGIRITREKAGTFNKDYLYLLHAWKQFLSNNSETIIFPCDDLPGSQAAVVSSSNNSYVSNFLLFNDYFGPKKV